MQGSAIQLVGEAIKGRIEAAGLSVLFGPLDQDKSSFDESKAFVLFPYRVVANADQRNREHEVPPNPDDADQQHAVVYDEALPLDVYFLLSAPRGGAAEWSGPRELGSAMQALNVPANTGLIVEGEIVHLSLEPVTTEEMGRIWSLFPSINYRTSVVYLATPVWIDPKQPKVVGPPVTHERYLPRHFAELEAT
jgi:hypothetical protein